MFGEQKFVTYKLSNYSTSFLQPVFIVILETRKMFFKDWYRKRLSNQVEKKAKKCMCGLLSEVHMRQELLMRSRRTEKQARC